MLDQLYGQPEKYVLPIIQLYKHNDYIRITVYYLLYTVIAGDTLSTDVLSVRIRKQLKDEAKKLGIDLRRVVEKALEEEIKRVKKEYLKKVVDEGLDSIKASIDEWVRAVKESRSKR